MLGIQALLGVESQFIVGLVLIEKGLRKLLLLAAVFLVTHLVLCFLLIITGIYLSKKNYI